MKTKKLKKKLKKIRNQLDYLECWSNGHSKALQGLEEEFKEELKKENIRLNKLGVDFVEFKRKAGSGRSKEIDALKTQIDKHKQALKDIGLSYVRDKKVSPFSNPKELFD